MEKQPCALCGKIRKLTFEHIPPQCAFNNKLIYVQRFEHHSDESSPVFGKSARSQRGFGKQALCDTCNNSTGSWYAKDFCEFAEQGHNILNEDCENGLVSGEYIIKPLNVLKQILVMFIAVDSSGILQSHKGVVNYLLNKESNDFPENLNIYLYSNASKFKRMLGYLIADYGNGIRVQWSEINYKPFGYFLTYNSPPPNEFMVNINGFNDKPYNQKYRVTLNTAYLAVSSLNIGTYDNLPNI